MTISQTSLVLMTFVLQIIWKNHLGKIITFMFRFFPCYLVAPLYILEAQHMIEIL